MHRTYAWSVYLCSAVIGVMFASATVQASSVPDLIRSAAARENIPPALIAAIFENESGFNPNLISSTGCVGLGQLCKSSAQRPNIIVQCEQDRAAGPQQCSPNCDTSNSEYNWCNSCIGSASSCVGDDRFNVQKNILESARVIASKVSSIESAGCNLETEAGIKAAAYAYNMGAGRLTDAINRLGCSDYTALWQDARNHFTPVSCTTDGDCGGSKTCGTHSEFTGNICLDDGDPIGVVFRSSPIPLSKLERKTDTDPGSYVSKIFADFEKYGGATPNGEFDLISLSASSFINRIAPGIRIGFPNLLIKIPGLSFNGATEEALIHEDTDGGKTIYIPFLGQYIAAVYRYLIGISSIVAGIVILVSGIQIITSAGQQTGIEQAKKRMIGALAGLFLIYGSYTILFIINPELIRLQSIKIPYVQGTSIFNEQVVDGELPIGSRQAMRTLTGSSPTPIPPGGISYEFNNVPWFFQYDSRWNNITYGNQSGCSSIGESGCAPASIATILAFYGKNVNPTNIAEIAVQTGARVCNNGTIINDNFLNTIDSTYSMVHATISRTEAIPLLRAGIPVFSGGAHEGYTSTGGTKSYGGHFIVFTGIENRMNTQTGQMEEFVRVNDPGNRPDKGITHMTVQMFLGQSREPTVFVPSNNIPPEVASLLP